MIKSSAVAGVVWKASEKLLWAKPSKIASCLGSSQRSTQREWQHQTWLNVTATSCSCGHYFPTTIPWGQRAWSDSAQGNLHYPLSRPLQVAHTHAGLIVTISGPGRHRAQQISVCLHTLVAVCATTRCVKIAWDNCKAFNGSVCHSALTFTRWNISSPSRLSDNASYPT